uniref:Ras-related GTP-binding protein n=1 Tax=Hucho hucho TaxID=62062 RepID=A0A4W5LZG4_9TELE
MSNTAMKKKVLLMGKSGSGKTSKRSIIFANYIAETHAHSHVQFLDNLVLNLWDCKSTCVELEKDMHYYQSCLEVILQNSPDTKVCCMVSLACTCFRTSIWGETLHKVAARFLCQLETNLRTFAQIIEADGVISHYQCKEQRDAHHFEKISNIKHFKLSCSLSSHKLEPVDGPKHRLHMR